MIYQTGDAGKVRLATRDDRPALLGMCREISDEYGFFGFSEHKSAAAVDRLLGPDGLIGVIGPSDDLYGSIGIAPMSDWYSEDVFLGVVWQFVVPAHRHSTTARDLLAFAKIEADRLGLRLVGEVADNERTQGKIRCFQRNLGAPVGATFVYNGDPIS